MDNFDYKKYLAEGKLFEEDFKNPILDKYLELKKSIDYKTVFPTDLQSFLDSLDNTEREGLKRDLAEGKLLKEDTSLDGLKKAKPGTTVTVGKDKYVKKAENNMTVNQPTKHLWWQKNKEDKLVHSNELAKLMEGKIYEGKELDVIETDNRDSQYTILRLSNGDYVEVNVIELYQNLMDNQE